MARVRRGSHNGVHPHVTSHRNAFHVSGRAPPRSIERWLDARSRLGLGGRQPAFCTLRGHPMTDAYGGHMPIGSPLTAEQMNKLIEN